MEIREEIRRELEDLATRMYEHGNGEEQVLAGIIRASLGAQHVGKVVELGIVIDTWGRNLIQRCRRAAANQN